MKKYSVKEVYYTVQGEGFHTGRPAVFIRFSGCNLWTGREQDRHKAICKFCDTDFWGTDGINGGKYTSSELVLMIKSLWPCDGETTPYIVCTGGEPLLQMDEGLIKEMRKNKIEIGLETNGTYIVPQGIDWICISPKANTEIVAISGNEIKIIFPQDGIDPTDFESWDFKHFYLQPMDDEHLEVNTAKTLQYCLDNPKWKVSLQTHKILNIP